MVRAANHKAKMPNQSVYRAASNTTLSHLCVVSEEPFRPTEHAGGSEPTLAHSSTGHTVQPCTCTQTERVKNLPPPPQSLHRCCPERCLRARGTGRTEGWHDQERTGGMRDGLEAKMVRRWCVHARKERTEGAQNRPTWNGLGSGEDRPESARGEEAGGSHASFQHSPGAVAFKYSLGPFVCSVRHCHIS